MKPSGRGLLGLPSSLDSEPEAVSLGMGWVRTEEGRELAMDEMSAAGAEVVVGVVFSEEELELSSEEDSSSEDSSEESSEVSTGALVAVGAEEPVRVMVVVQGLVSAGEEPAKVGSPVGSG